MTTPGQKVRVRHCVMDGRIAPYELPWIATRLIALKDYGMTMLGRAGGMALLEKAFATDGYSKEDLQYVAGILKHRSRKTIWRTFESCNNHKLPDLIPERGTKLPYWYAENGEKERKRDILIGSAGFRRRSSRFCRSWGMRDWFP